jgi:small subunit ribosomal protein S10
MKTIKLILKLKSFHPYYLNKFVILVQKKLKSFNIFLIKQIFLPKKKQHFTVLRSPHVDKKARDQFEKITYNRLLVLEIQNNNIDNSLLIYRFLHMVSQISNGIEFRIKYFLK